MCGIYTRYWEPFEYRQCARVKLEEAEGGFHELIAACVAPMDAVYVQAGALNYPSDWQVHDAPWSPLRLVAFEEGKNQGGVIRCVCFVVVTDASQNNHFRSFCAEKHSIKNMMQAPWQGGR